MKDESKLDKAKRELDDFNSLISEDFTDVELWLSLKFYKAGIELNQSYTTSLEKQIKVMRCCGNCDHVEMEMDTNFCKFTDKCYMEGGKDLSPWKFNEYLLGNETRLN